MNFTLLLLAFLGPSIPSVFQFLSFVMRLSSLCLTLYFENNLLISIHTEVERYSTWNLTHEPQIGTCGLYAIQPMCYHSLD